MIKIFDGPAYLMLKIRREHNSLKAALESNDLIAAGDAVFNFSVSSYHVLEWIVRYRPDLKGKLASVRGHECMRVIRDICNASKHVELDEGCGSYRTYPPVAASLETSASSSALMGGVSESVMSPSWVLKVVMKDGDRKKFDEVADSVVSLLDGFFVRNGLYKNVT